MTKLSQLLATLAFVCLALSQAPAQTPFWSEDFANGFPAEWTTQDASGQGAVWTWCANPETGQSNGCPPIFDDAINQQVPFAAPTATNGFVTMDSDKFGELAVDHVSQLITDTIDCQAYPTVFLRFYTQIGVFTVPAETGAILRVSNDAGATWTDFTIFPGLTTQERWSDNPEEIIVDISSVAGGQQKVMLQWQWTGNWEFMWNIDDVELFDADPTPPYSIELGDFFYPPASFAQPVTQIGSDTMGFFADLNNVGALAVTNLVLKATIRNEAGDVLFQDSILIDELAPGVTDSTFVLDNVFVPEGLDVGVYSIEYEVYSLDVDDAKPSDNFASEIFLVTENLYSKENGPTTAYRPGGGPADYMVGNVYQTGKNWVDAFKATEVTFGAAKNADDGPLMGDVVNIVLLEINEDELAPDWSNFDDQANMFSNPAFTLRAFVPHTWVSAETFDVESEMLVDFNEETPGVALKPGNRYLVLCSYEGDNNVAFQAFNEDISYFQISTVVWDGGAGQWFLGGFGPEPAAVIRMAIDLVNTTDEKRLPEQSLQFFPNPVNDLLQVQIQLEQPTLANLTLAETSGRVIRIEELPNASTESLQLDVSHLPAGTYLLRLATAEGTLTRQFVIQR